MKMALLCELRNNYFDSRIYATFNQLIRGKIKITELKYLTKAFNLFTYM